MDHQTSADQALSQDWLGRTDQTLAYYRAVRDGFMPGKPFWNTETADAPAVAIPGRHLPGHLPLPRPLGRLARQEVTVVFHNTLTSMTTVSWDEKASSPGLDFSGCATSWRGSMGTSIPASHRGCTSMPIACVASRAVWRCWPSTRAGKQPASIALPMPAERYTLAADGQDLEDAHVRLNGDELALGAEDELPSLRGSRVPPGPGGARRRRPSPSSPSRTGPTRSRVT